MAASITISSKTDPDLVRIHDLAQQIARWAGLPVIEQIRFATEIAELGHKNRNEVTFSVVKTDDDRQTLRAVSGRDSTERTISPDVKNIENFPSFREVTKEYWEQAYRDMQQFTFALTHDLKNSMTKLRLALSLAEEEELQPPMDSYMQIIYRAADRLEGIMLSLNKVIQLGDSSPDVVKKIIPEKIFTDVQEEFAEQLNGNVSITRDFRQVSEMRYIEVHLKSIFSNLVSNAIKYCSPDRPLQVSVACQKQDGQTILRFSDNGEGIDLKKNGEKIFSPFTRFSTSKEGSGIGLYLIKNIAERNGGRIEVDSTPGVGTTFTLFLKEYELPN